MIDVELLKASLNSTNSIHFIEDLDVIENLGFAAFSVSERGPIVSHSDVSNLEIPGEIKNSESFLHKLAITCISTLGFGQEYIEGILELPSFGIRDHRLILLSTLLGDENNEIKNVKSHLHNDHMEYFQLAIWFPRELLVGIPPLSIFENMLLCSIKDEVKCVQDTTIEQITNLKNSLTQLILATALCKNV